MQTEQKNYVGIDVSKPCFDASLMLVKNHLKQDITTSRFLNNYE
jgi:hypothetical protein